MKHQTKGMENIFEKTANQNLIERIEKLSPESEPLWGKMSVAQMLWHSQRPMEVAAQKLILKRGIIGFLFGKMAKRSFLSGRGFGKNSPTVPEFKATEPREFEKEKRNFLGMIRQFGDAGPNILASKKHPFFGEMTDAEWGKLLYMHTDHHLKQFGV